MNLALSAVFRRILGRTTHILLVEQALEIVEVLLSHGEETAGVICARAILVAVEGISLRHLEYYLAGLVDYGLLGLQLGPDLVVTHPECLQLLLELLNGVLLLLDLVSSVFFDLLVQVALSAIGHITQFLALSIHSA